jgi:uncharacterized integral membrane protein
VLLPLAAAIVLIAVANRHAVTLSFDPLSADKPVLALTLPLFVILFLALLAGVIVGGVAAWLRQRRWRRAARRREAEVRRLKAENEVLKNRIEDGEHRPAGNHAVPVLVRRLPAA